MEKYGGVSPSRAVRYVAWEELLVPPSGDKGRKEVRFYLRRKDGSLDLAVVGREKKDMILRHANGFRYVIQNRFLGVTSSPSSFSIKLRSLKDVHDWLNSFVSDGQKFSAANVRGRVDEESPHKELAHQKAGRHIEELVLIGSPWTCKKRRRHYQSFCRNGVTISVNNFVYVLAVEGNRLIAHLVDLYEDTRGMKMVKVRWFHKIDEVGMELPHDYNRREIFFSLCDQDLSIECIDGLAIVLAPQHFEKFLNEAKDIQLEAYVCRRQYDNEDLEAFDVTQIKGYWDQEILRYMLITSANDLGNCNLPDSYLKPKGLNDDSSGMRPRKRLRLPRDGKQGPRCTVRKGFVGTPFVSTVASGAMGNGCNSEPCHGGVGAVPYFPTVGSQIEVLSQDSGLRGCWFRASIIKRHKEKIKVRYIDLQDVDDATRNLEEWVLASRIAASDGLGIRLDGRMTVRPYPLAPNGSKVSWAIDIGSLVDVWWHHGWWEGVVIQKAAGEKFRVYFQGEKREAIFAQNDLRHSREWLQNVWMDLMPRPDVAVTVLSSLKSVGGKLTARNENHTQVLPFTEMKQHCQKTKDNLLQRGETRCSGSLTVCSLNKNIEMGTVIDLSKDDFLSQLRWSSRKRRKGGGVIQKLSSDKESPEREISRSSGDKISNPSPMKVDADGCKSIKVDRDKCKFMGDSVFKSSVVPALTSLVMSR